MKKPLIGGHGEGNVVGIMEEDKAMPREGLGCISSNYHFLLTPLNPKPFPPVAPTINLPAASRSQGSPRQSLSFLPPFTFPPGLGRRPEYYFYPLLPNDFQGFQLPGFLQQ